VLGKVANFSSLSINHTLYEKSLEENEKLFPYNLSFNQDE